MNVLQSLKDSSYLQIRGILEVFKSGLTPDRAIELIGQLSEYANDPEQGLKELDIHSPKFKVIYNDCYGGRSLSKEAMNELGNHTLSHSFSRTDERIVQMIEDKGSDYVSGPSSCLQIARVPQGANWTIDEYDGWETVTW